MINNNEQEISKRNEGGLVMSVTVVNEWWFKKDANIEEGKAAALELVDYMKAEEPSVQLSLWIQDRKEPLHHFHITVFDDHGSFLKLRESEGIKRFVDKFWPLIIRDKTYKSPDCDVWLSSVSKIDEVGI
jgi:quinol monooxygenase YgiN